MTAIEMNAYAWIDLFAYMIGCSVLLQLVVILGKRSYLEEKQRYINGMAILIGTMMFVIAHVVVHIEVKVVIYFCFYTLFCHVVFRIPIQKVVLAVTTYVAMVISFEMLVILVIMTHFHMPFDVVICEQQPKALYQLITKPIELVALPLSYRIPIGEGKRDISHKASNMIMLVFLILIGMTIVFLIYHNSGIAHDFIGSFYLLLCLGAAVCVIYVFSIVVANDEKKQKMQAIQTQNEVLKTTLEENQAYYEYWEQNIHDYKNTMLSLRGMLAQSGQKEIQEYLENELDIMREKDHFVKSGNAMIDSILSMKWIGANRRGIYFSIQGHVKEELPIPDIQFGKILGNLLDNAIEGAVQSGREPYVEVVLAQTEDVLVLEINNSCRKDSIDFERTSKEDSRGHGLGIQSVRQLVYMYEGAFSITQRGNRVSARIEF
ncbi:MAG: GHKL domain-containing protein [Lachnospiraceae bacterium]|nr:GHKL domain-containing protein [Lachnospiraceae bacterium]